jgi:hypothetical protein
MKKGCIIFIVIFFFAFSLHASAQGNAIFPQENVAALTVLSVDINSSSFVIMDNDNEMITGYAGDYLGSEGAKVVMVTESYITLETIEMVIGEAGNQYKQPSRMNIPLSFATFGQGKGIGKSNF